MDIVKKEKKLCIACMEEHEISIVNIIEYNIFKNLEIEYLSTHYYCEKCDEYYVDEHMIINNDISMKDAYRKKVGLLTSLEIMNIRKKYEITQTDLALLLGWGAKTITRYESHQVQDIAHDTVLRKINEDPEWYLSLLKNAKTLLSQKSYDKYLKKVVEYYSENKDIYLEKSILSQYAKYNSNLEYSGNRVLCLKKVIDVICYFANSNNVKSLYTVKLMKMLWYADALSYKKYNHSITGLIYKALPMGAVPMSYESIIELKDINYEKIEFDENIGYRFIPSINKTYQNLNAEDIIILDIIINKFGNMSKSEIVKQLHEEVAYNNTKLFDIINYKYTINLSIE